MLNKIIIIEMPKKSVSKKTKDTKKKAPYYGEDGNELWTVEKILGRKFINNKAHYLVKWEGFPSSDNSWEPLENVSMVSQMIEDFEKRYCPDSDTEINLQESSPVLKKIHKQVKSQPKASRRLIKKAEAPEDNEGEKTRRKPEKTKSTTENIPKKDDFELDLESDEEDESDKRDATRGDINFDVPTSIAEHAYYDKKNTNYNTSDLGQAGLSDLLYKVEWKTDHGKRKNPTYYEYNLLKKRCPELLLDYLEKVVKF